MSTPASAPGSGLVQRRSARQCRRANPSRGSSIRAVLAATRSSAAAATSAIVAATSAYRDDLDFLSLVSFAQLAGPPLGRQADLCVGGSDQCQRVRYLSFCSTLSKACGAAPSRCPGEDFLCPARPLDPPVLSQNEFELDPPPEVIAAADFEPGATYIAECSGPGPYFRAGLEPIDPCPGNQRYGTPRRPWTQPQPHSDPCPNCLLNQGGGGGSPFRGGDATKQQNDDDSRAVLYIELAAGYDQVLSDPTLTLCVDQPERRISYNLNPAMDSRFQTLQVEGLPSTCEAATLSFTVDGRSSVTTSLLVAH